MRPLETVLIGLLLTASLIWLLVPRSRRLILWPGVPALLLIAGHLAWEGYRWQMVPAYVVAGLFLLMGWRTRRPPPPPEEESTIRFHIRRRYRWLPAIVAFGLLLLLMVSLPLILPVIRLPAPTGPYAVGVTDLHLVDTGRAETFTADPNDRRELMVRVWYPADPAPGAARAPYLDHPEVRAASIAAILGWPSFTFRHLALVHTHSVRDAPPAAGQAAWPVLLYSHGYRAGRETSTYMTEELASHGYVVVSIDHPYESLAVVFPDGRIARPMPPVRDRDPRQELREVRALYRRLWADDEQRSRHEELLDAFMGPTGLLPSLAIWVDDIRLVADYLEVLNTGDGPFAGRLDLSRLGALGHSFGGAASAQFCAEDDRCRAGVNLDGGQVGSVVDSGIDRPFLFMYSEHNRWLNHIVYARSRGPAYQMTIRGAGHLNFADVPFAPAVFKLISTLGPIKVEHPIDPGRGHAVANAYTRAFFDQHLRGQDSPLLRGPAEAFPEVVLEYK